MLTSIWSLAGLHRLSTRMAGKGSEIYRISGRPGQFQALGQLPQFSYSLGTGSIAKYPFRDHLDALFLSGALIGRQIEPLQPLTETNHVHQFMCKHVDKQSGEIEVFGPVNCGE